MVGGSQSRKKAAVFTGPEGGLVLLVPKVSKRLHVRNRRGYKKSALCIGGNPYRAGLRAPRALYARA